MEQDLRELYQEVILDHGKHPRNHRHPPDANHEARGYNPLCGDQVTVYLSTDEAGKITDAAFEGHGCAISIASASMMTEILLGKTEAEARQLFDDFHRLQVLAGVREFPVRVKCATLAWHAMASALNGGEDATTE